MSQLGIFDTLDEDTVLAIQAKGIALMLEGKTIMEWSGEGTEVTREFTMSIPDMLEECKYTLKQKWPQTYGYPVNRVRPYFGGYLYPTTSSV
jgi:hypothetical protein